MLRFLYVLSVLALSATTAQAANFCLTGGDTRLLDGDTIHETLSIVVASYPRPQITGYETDRSWCSLDRRALGGYMRSDIVEQPKSGTLFVNTYKIRYRGDKIGHDHFVIKHHWLGPRNEQFSGTIVVEVDIVPQPF